MNRPIRGVAVTSMVIFAALMINLSYLYVGQQNYLNERPENRRVADARFAQDRGPIMVGNTADRRSRRRSRTATSSSAPTPPASCTRRSPATTPTSTARPGWRRPTPASSPASTTPSSSHACSSSATGSTKSGATLETTIDAKAQKAAWNGLAGRKGAVVAIDYTTGAIKALVSFPSYDPNDLATHDLTASEPGLEAAQRRPRPAAVQPGDPRDLSARLDVQARHRRCSARRRHEPRHPHRRVPVQAARLDQGAHRELRRQRRSRSPVPSRCPATRPSPGSA